MSRTPSMRRRGLTAALALASVAAGASTAGAAAPPVSQVQLATHPPLNAFFLPNLQATNPSPGTYRITNTGRVATGAFLVRIHRVGVKAGSTFTVASLAPGQSFSRYLGNVCDGLPPAFEI